MQTLAIIDGLPITLDTSGGQEVVTFVGDLDVDCDGSGGNPDHDRYYQPDTALHHNGRALNAYKVPFVVVPPIVCRKTKGLVLGSHCLVHPDEIARVNRDGTAPKPGPKPRAKRRAK